MKASAFVVSYPKSGRTWIRVFYFSYLSALTKRPFTLDASNYPEFPQTLFSHDLWSHQTSRNWRYSLTGRHLIPARARKTRKIVLLVRDPRDVLVSHHIHGMNRKRHTDWKPPESLKVMLRDPLLGIRNIVNLMNEWYAEWSGYPNFLLMRYEDCRSQPEIGMKPLLEFLGFETIDPAAFAHALEFSRFENMQSMEAKGEFKEKVLRCGDPEVPDSFKARRGKVGGFEDYFDASDQAFAATEIGRLHPDFGYAP